MPGKGVVLFDSDAGVKIIKQVCEEEGVSLALLIDLLDAELEQVGKARKRGLRDRFDEILDGDYED